MNAPVLPAPWWGSLLADDFICGRQTPAERDVALAADPAWQAARAAARRSRAAHDERTGERIRGMAVFEGRCRGHYAYWETRPGRGPELAAD